MSRLAPGRPLLIRALAGPVIGVVAAAACVVAQASAQYMQSYFPRGVPGFGAERGVTVLTRERPDYDPPGERAADFVVQPRLTEATGYDSRVTAAGAGSWVVNTAPSVSVNSDWERDRLGAALTLDNYQALDQPRQSQTDWTAAIGAAKTIDRTELNLGYSHLSLHERSTDFGAVASDTPVAYRVDDVRADYTISLGRLSLIPNADLRAFAFDATTVGGVPVSQSYRDRTVAQAGVTARYGLSEQRSLLLVITGQQSHYTLPQPGQPSSNSRSGLVLAGLDYLDDGMIRYQFLAGGEVRVFEAATYGTRIAPVTEARVIWSPTGLTTVTGQLMREIEDPAAEGTGGFTYTGARLILDHEYRRDLLLQARAGVEVAEYIHGGGTQAAASLGASATWLVNRNMRLALSYDVTDQGPSGNTAVATTHSPSSITTGAYTRSVALLTVHLGL